MNKSKLVEEVFKMRFDDVFSRFQQKRLTCEEASALLGVSVSTFFRKRQRSLSDEFNGIFDQRLGKPSPNRAADKEVDFITKLYSSRFQGFTASHFYSFAKREYGLKKSYTWTKNKLQEHGLISKSSKGGKHRKRREPKPMVGMMLHQDGSTHHWIPALDYNLDLIITLDDATSKITSGFFVEQEGTLSTFQAIEETIKSFGLFCSLYTDRGSHYFYTPKAGKKVDKDALTQVGRALKQLGIQHIAAYSPEARGRSERAFRTIQDRLPKEFSLFNITTIAEANKYLKDKFIPAYNNEFARKATSDESAFVPWVGNSLKDILCIQEQRIVQKDNTVRYGGLILQIPKNDFRPHYVKASVTVHRYSDYSLAIFYGHLCIGKYNHLGKLIDCSNELKKAINQ